MYEDLFTNDEDPFASSEPPTTPTPPEQPRKRSIGSDKDRLAMWHEAGADAVLGLYKHDPLIRASIDSQLQADNDPQVRKHESNLVYDELGRLIGTKSSPMNTSRAQTELMEAIRKDFERKLGITHGE